MNKKSPSRLNKRRIAFRSLPSTNDFCKGDGIPNGAVVTAERQSRGHGRMGRNFFSEQGGLYVSFCYILDGVSPEGLLPVTGMCAVAVLRSLKRVSDISPKIKWTNDILLNSKKICGILAETVFSDDGSCTPHKLIIGIGINCNQGKAAFDGELSGIASSLLLETGTETDKEKLLAALTEEIDRIFFSVTEGADISEYLDEYRASCETLGKEIHILSPALSNGKDPRQVFAETPNIFPTALALDIDRAFGLTVKMSNGHTETLTSGEVTVR